jgi:hypothetical protein
MGKNTLTSFNAVNWHFPGGTEETRERPQFSRCPNWNLKRLFRNTRQINGTCNVLEEDLKLMPNVVKRHHFGNSDVDRRIILTGSKKSTMRMWTRLKRCSTGSKSVVTENSRFLKIKNL